MLRSDIKIFYSRSSVKNKVCNLIIDNENCENMVFRVLEASNRTTLSFLRYLLDQEKPLH